MNYTELVQSIKDYAEYEETTFVANIDTFIRNAETNILRSVEIPELRKNSGGVLTQDFIYLQRPSDFLAPFSLAASRFDATSWRPLDHFEDLSLPVIL